MAADLPMSPFPYQASTGTAPSSEAFDWQPVSEAAAAARIPVRTVYNWVNAKKLAQRRIDGTAHVDANAVRALAATRNGALPPSTHSLLQEQPFHASNGVGIGASDDNGGMDGIPDGNDDEPPAEVEPLDGELAAKLFDAFAQGRTPIDAVREFKLSPSVVRQAWDDFTELRELAGTTGGASIEDRKSTRLNSSHS